ITAHFIAEAYKKAGSLNTEKFIDAMEGLQIQSPVGRIEMRACDHQAILPMNFGVTKLSPEYGVAIATDIYTLRGAEVMPSCKEIMEARGQ
ncbi:MAG: ABC transporter substrate-binding protein, partial [Desulfobacterales bacterium]